MLESTEAAVRLRPMNPAAVPASLVTTDSAAAVTPPGSAVDASPITLPATRMPVDARGLALGIVAVVALVFALSWAQTFVVPLLVSIVVSYTLNPLVTWLEAIQIPRVLGAVIVMSSVIGALVVSTYSLRGQVQTILEQLPEAATSLSAGLARIRISQIDTMQKMQNAATEVERATTQMASDSAVSRQRATHVIVDQSTFKLGNFLWANSMGALGAMGGAAMVGFLVFFLLLSGNTFKRKLVRLTGSQLSKRKITVRILEDINDSIQKYMLMLVTTNLLIALLSWIAFRWIGLENAGAWAAATGLLHIVPYLGPGITTVATGMAAFMQFNSFAMALLVEGWLWGVWGMLLSIPIIVIVKVVSQHVEQLHPMAELLGE
jgi:predicted PurR-regulated permease PerM